VSAIAVVVGAVVSAVVSAIAVVVGAVVSVIIRRMSFQITSP